jgi:DNA repair exonuclease SbcCD nuclease subunit
MAGDIRILLLADSHLGFDLPARTRVKRRRRGHDFLANYALALAPAFVGEVDVVVHAGDVFDRSSVMPTLAYQAFDPLRRIADRGIPVFIVPGNHERSRLPHSRFARHPRVHLFDSPRTFAIDVHGIRLALSGFPYERLDVRTRFSKLLDETGWRLESADLRLVCMHHCVEGATVGPGDFTFTSACDVVRVHDVPPDFSAVLSGHIHRHQVITRDLRRLPLETPVLYPGSIERTSLAEIDETKGFMTVSVGRSARVRWEFHPLPARPMLREEIVADGLGASQIEAAIREIVARAPLDAVVSIRVSGALDEGQWAGASASRLRTFVPESMNVDVIPAGGRRALVALGSNSHDLGALERSH